MSWHDLALNPSTIERFYDSVPALRRVEILKVAFDQQAATVSLAFNLADFPTRPPVKWRQAEFNTIQIGLDLIEVSSVNLEGWRHFIIADLEIEKENTQIKFTAKSDGFSLTAVFGSMRLGVSGYLKAEEMSS